MSSKFQTAIALVCVASVVLTACVAAPPGDSLPMPNEGVPPDADPYTLVPDPGPCEAAMPRYYYDPATRVCTEFLWGGCGGVVPFETMEECTSGAPAADGEPQADAGGDAAPASDATGSSDSPAAQASTSEAGESGNAAASEPASDPNEAVSVTNDAGTMEDPAIQMNCNATAEEVELYNISAADLNIGGYRLFNDDRSRIFTFPDGFILASQAYAYVVSGPDAEADPANSRLLFTTDDVWTGNFEAANLENMDGTLVAQVICFNY